MSARECQVGLMSSNNSATDSPIGKRLLVATLSLLFMTSHPALAWENVFFPSLDGPLTGGKPTQLHGLLMKPDGIGPFPAIVALHGCNGLFKGGTLVAREAAWAQLLTSHGYVVLFPDSFGPRDVTSDCEGRVRAWAERSYDTYGALRYLQAQPFVIGERIGLMGWSHGGGTVILPLHQTASLVRPICQKVIFALQSPSTRHGVRTFPLIGNPTSRFCSRLARRMTRSSQRLASRKSTRPKPAARRCKSKSTTAPFTISIGRATPHTITSPSGKVAHYGVNEDARADALTRVLAFFDSRLKP
jgi:dienelactone hydrolase